MISLRKVVDELAGTPPALRRAVLARHQVDTLREAWDSCAEVETLARLARSLLPSAAVALALSECVRALLLKLELGESSLMAVVDATSKLSGGQGLIAGVQEAMENTGSAPPAEAAEYNAYAAVVNLHKFLFLDEEKGIQGVVFFCVEAMLSKEHPTWDSAECHVADLFRSAISKYTDAMFEAAS